MASDWSVHKFGGSSLADAPAFRHVAELLDEEDPGPRAVVVSAMSGMTDALLRLVELAARRDASHAGELRRLRSRQLEVVGELLPGPTGSEIAGTIASDCNDIEDVLRAVWLMRSIPPHAADLVAGYGELWSARVLAAHLGARGENVEGIDARDVLRVHHGSLGPAVLWDETERRMAARRAGSTAARLVIPGFVASTAEGLPTTLGRNGSDWSAAIFAALLDARRLDIWTDVDGVMSADPRRVPDARVLDRLSYDEAMELAYFGAKVIHPATMAPAVSRGIPIRIRNTFRPEAPGTLIGPGAPAATPVQGLAAIEGMALLNLEGAGMIGVPGVAERLFGALRAAEVSVVLISQGSSEHSICFAVPAAQAERARTAVERAFAGERSEGAIQTLEVQREVAILAVVGDGMAGVPGVAGKCFEALGNAGINIRAIAQGSSERNISLVIDAADATRALRAVHSGFWLSRQTLSIGIVGPGRVGSTLLDQLASQAERLRRTARIDLRVRAVAGRERMVLDERGLPLERWREALSAAAVPGDLDRLADHVRTDSIPHAAIVDCTASASVAAHYAGWLERGLHVITSNKIAGAGPLAVYERLRAPERKTHFLYETTVGAGLPVIHTLRDLLRTGDEVLGIEGILSGTLSWLFNSFDGSRPFSDLLREAHALGFTEPDPREDLSGMDVARKVVILARELGLSLELGDVEVESLVPPELREGDVAGFLERASALDEPLAKRVAEAGRAGEVLRYVGTVEPTGRSVVRLAGYPLTHPFARMRRTDNVVQFRTRRYDENPLIVQGPGAGPEVTAAGVFGDLLRLAAQL